MEKLPEAFGGWAALVNDVGLPLIIILALGYVLWKKDARIDTLVDRQHSDAVQNAKVMEQSAAAIRELIQEVRDLRSSVGRGGGR